MLIQRPSYLLLGHLHFNEVISETMPWLKGNNSLEVVSQVEGTGWGGRALRVHSRVKLGEQVAFS